MLLIVKASTVPVAGAGSVGSMLLAEDLLLLVADDASGRLSAPAAQVDAGPGFRTGGLVTSLARDARDVQSRARNV